MLHNRLLSFLGSGILLGKSSLGLCGISFSFSSSNELVVLLDGSFPPGSISLEDSSLGASRSLTILQASSGVLTSLGTVVLSGLIGSDSSLLEGLYLQLRSLLSLGSSLGLFNSFNFTLTSAFLCLGLHVFHGGSKDASSASLVKMVILIASSSPGRGIVHVRYLVVLLDQFSLLGAEDLAVSLLLKFLEGDSICPSS